MKQASIHFCMVLLMILNSSCIHTQTDEVKRIQEAPDSNLTQIQVGTSEINYLIYRTSKLPLEDFFFHLKKGDYDKAFHQMDIRFKSANFQDDAIIELMDAGFVPVYVKIKNNGTSSIEFDEKYFSLIHGSGSVKAFYSEHLPREFKKFSPKAVAANVYNTSVVVVGFAAVLGLLIVAGAKDFAPFTGSGTGPPLDTQNPVYNDVHTNVRVDYKNYLLTKTKLEPGQEAKGLLFFNIGDSKLTSDSNLVFQR